MPVVLVIEDDHAVREVVGRVLSAQAFDVLLAPSGEDAMALEASNAVDLIVSDIVLPGRDGFQVVAEIQRRSPHIQSLFISGQFDPEMAVAAGWPADVPVMTKPFSLTDLVRKVRSLAESAPQPGAAQARPPAADLVK